MTRSWDLVRAIPGPGAGACSWRACAGSHFLSTRATLSTHRQRSSGTAQHRCMTEHARPSACIAMHYLLCSDRPARSVTPRRKVDCGGAGGLGGTLTCNGLGNRRVPLWRLFPTQHSDTPTPPPSTPPSTPPQRRYQLTLILVPPA